MGEVARCLKPDDSVHHRRFAAAKIVVQIPSKMGSSRPYRRQETGPNAMGRVRFERDPEKRDGPVGRLSSDVLLAEFGFEGCGQRRKNLEQVADHAVARLLEDGRVGVLVNGDDQLGVAHTDEMLDGA